MKILLKSLFLGLTLAILSYSAIAAGANNFFSSEGRTCCTYQVNCPEDQECKTIFPECSQDQPHICKKSTTKIDLISPSTQ